MWVVWFSEPLWMRDWHSVASTRGQCLGWLRIHDLVPLLVFNVEESEVTLSFVPLKVTSFCCLDAFIFFSLAFTFEIQILAFSKAERGHVWTEKSWCSLFPVKHYGEMRWKFKLSHVTKSQPEGSPSTERLSLSVSWSGWTPQWQILIPWKWISVLETAKGNLVLNSAERSEVRDILFG